MPRTATTAKPETRTRPPSRPRATKPALPAEPKFIQPLPKADLPKAGLPEDAPPGAVLWQPVPQIEGKPTMKVEWVKVTPDMARKWVAQAVAEQETGFKQRLVVPRDVRRWKLLMETRRFVEWLPNGPICFDETGLLLNGMHRFTALGGQDESFGFMVVKNVPRWMFKYFDTMRVRSLNDVFRIAGRMTQAQTGSTMRLAMRYEEMLRGARKQIGWKEWPSQRDEHADVDEFLSRREDLADLYLPASQANSKSKLIIASLMVFRFYQSLAWPEGEQQLLAFWEGLHKGAMLNTGNPALALREWSKDLASSRERVYAKREVHLMLLFNMFAEYAQDHMDIDRIRWAHGMPMLEPYHPDGPQVAVKNVLAAVES